MHFAFFRSQSRLPIEKRLKDAFLSVGKWKKLQINIFYREAKSLGADVSCDQSFDTLARVKSDTSCTLGARVKRCFDHQGRNKRNVTLWNLFGSIATAQPKLEKPNVRQVFFDVISGP